jgi:hypothetical protein
MCCHRFTLNINTSNLLAATPKIFIEQSKRSILWFHQSRKLTGFPSLSYTRAYLPHNLFVSLLLFPFSHYYFHFSFSLRFPMFYLHLIKWKQFTEANTHAVLSLSLSPSLVCSFQSLASSLQLRRFPIELYQLLFR